MKKRQQKGTSKTSLIFIAVAVFAVLGYIIMRNNSTPPYVPVQQQQEVGIQSDNDLMYVSSELDSVDVDSMDDELNQNDADAATF